MGHPNGLGWLREGAIRGLGAGMGREAGFSAPQLAKARAAPVEMTISGLR